MSKNKQFILIKLLQYLMKKWLVYITYNKWFTKRYRNRRKIISIIIFFSTRYFPNFLPQIFLLQFLFCWIRIFRKKTKLKESLLRLKLPFQLWLEWPLASVTLDCTGQMVTQQDRVGSQVYSEVTPDFTSCYVIISPWDRVEIHPSKIVSVSAGPWITSWNSQQTRNKFY